MKNSPTNPNQNKSLLVKSISRRNSRRTNSGSSRHAFTLVQILFVIAIVAILSALLFGVFGRARETARRTQCDTRLKAIALALDAYKQNNGSFPATLAALNNDKYLRDAETLRCPGDPRQDGQAGYEEFYVVRAARDANDMPLVVCPFHEEGGHGMQAFKGRYTTQHATRTARITASRNATILRPGKAPIAASAGMELRGGDRIRTGGTPPASTMPNNGVLGGGVGGVVGTVTNSNNTNDGEVVIEFADGSTATLRSGTTVTVLQSFLMSETNAPLYTLIRQGVGEAIYKVHSGSKFDVVTPTATSGARGTEFKITVKENGETDLYVIEGKVAFSTLRKTVIAPLQQTVSGLLNGLIGLL